MTELTWYQPGATKTFPAAFNLDNIISVAALATNGLLRTDSNFGSVDVDLAAPGTGLVTTSNLADNQILLNFAGTSGAAPLVAGSVALLRAHFSEPYTETISRLLGSVTFSMSLEGNVGTGGRLNLDRSFDLWSFDKDNGGNWGWIEWFGNFNNLFDPWINHAELGFMTASVDSHSGNLFLFSSDMGQQANGQPGELVLDDEFPISNPVFIFPQRLRILF